jgi:anionic cell wall polymer biosynthesis LytR-Cps2A-Psr (LCP) family protein
MNILVMGLESRTNSQGQDLSAAQLKVTHSGKESSVTAGTLGAQDTDTLILVHVFAGGQKAVGFSIHRDDLVDFPHATLDGLCIQPTAAQADGIKIAGSSGSAAAGTAPVSATVLRGRPSTVGTVANAVKKPASKSSKSSKSGTKDGTSGASAVTVAPGAPYGIPCVY